MRRAVSAFTREGDETVVAACITVDAKKAVRKHAELNVDVDLSLDEMCHRGAVPPRSGEEGLEFVPDDFVKERLLGLVAFVLDGEGSVGTRAKRRGEGPESCLLEGVQASGLRACTGLLVSHREATASSRSICEKVSNAQDDFKMTWSESARHPKKAPGQIPKHSANKKEPTIRLERTTPPSNRISSCFVFFICPMLAPLIFSLFPGAPHLARVG